ncbi:hypothetical protein CN645_34400 [Burkholderia sp. IDO3]|nr:hypothetical protein DCN14_32100 [Burkholderia sp. IDO3]PCD57354.1 hypothetical protein CN645_34400 [Burkholderia sp. IDO3]
MGQGALLAAMCWRRVNARRTKVMHGRSDGFEVKLTTRQVGCPRAKGSQDTALPAFARVAVIVRAGGAKASCA